jgi:hypothetical protein
MTTIVDIIKRLLPEGSVTGARGSILKCPDWPPDLFAVAATLIELQGLYARPRYVNGWDNAIFAFGKDHVPVVRRIARGWRRSGQPPRRLQGIWNALLKHRLSKVGLQYDAEDGWSLHVLQLLAIADEASVHVGFVPDPSESGTSSPFAKLVFEELGRIFDERSPQLLPYLPSSLCKQVPDSEACVQPKTNLPVVGCTLRSLSHHLALLPPTGVVCSNWYFANPDERTAAYSAKSPAHTAENECAPLNLLLVPFPYVIRSRDFVLVPPVDPDACHYFSIEPGWMRRDGQFVDEQDVVDFVARLLEMAKLEVECVHGVIFPESALLDVQCEAIAAGVARLDPKLELFITGTVSPSSEGSQPPRGSRNEAFTARLDNGRVLHVQRQGKHHRWRLERSQIERYNLQSVFDPEVTWWEKTDLSPRECNFNVVRRGATLSVLICEDLARFDPVMPVINAVGPNLVVALLMDGPQWKDRWPARYATVLADDPGSSVLTLTSLGMIRRSSGTTSKYRRTVAMWKEPDKTAEELDLEPGDHALLISLAMELRDQESLDRRKDGGTTVKFQLATVHPLRLRSLGMNTWPELG